MTAIRKFRFQKISIVLSFSVRTILFGIIYTVTFGKHKLWILPNLTEDCGVLESFQPWYTYECCGDDKKENKKDKKEKKSKKAKDSDAEEEVDEPSADPEQKECEDEEDAEKYSQASTDENYEKIDDEV